MPDHLRDSLRRQGRRFARFWVRARNRQNGACCGEALESGLVMPGRRRAGEGKMRCGGLLLRFAVFFTRKKLFLIAGNPLVSSRFCFRFDRNRSLALGRLPAHGKKAGKARNTPRWERRIRKPVPGNPSFLDGKKFQTASKSYVQPKPVIRHAGAFFRLGE